jgi:membrane-bound ClpP family serine protease
MEPWVYAVLLLALGLSLSVLEIFFTSAGLLAFLAAASLIGAVYMGFRQGPTAGFVLLGVAVVGLPAVIVLAFKWWPRTAMGRRVLLFAPKSEEVLPDDPQKRFLKSLVGSVGQARSKMLPSGVVNIDGHVVNALSEGVPIEVGQRVRVIQVRGNRVVVRPVEEETPVETAENPLERPIDAVVPDPFDEPSA